MATQKQLPLSTAGLRVSPGKRFAVNDRNAAATPGWKRGKEAAAPVLARLNERLEALQETLYAEGKRRLLVVLQGMDTSGKDGVIRRVFEGVNPTGVRVESFKAPTEKELAHDFLWRVHAVVPQSGEIAIFNRSHYEDVLVVRVRSLAPEKTWRPRYRQIAEFERMLAESGTTILKFFLHISREEQRERLQARVDDPDKRWKFRASDLEDRALWTEYQQAYAEALSRTSTPYAPWYAIPADRKWFRDLAIASVLVETLEGLQMRLPPGERGAEALKIR
jgi:PPK2 family polyphosphate:nucleotide phosphotransferase